MSNLLFNELQNRASNIIFKLKNKSISSKKSITIDGATRKQAFKIYYDFIMKTNTLSGYENSDNVFLKKTYINIIKEFG